MGLREVKEDFYKNWVTPDGLALLDPNGQESDNGTLFLAIFLMLCHECKVLDELDITRSFNAIKSVELEPGLFCRSANMKQKMESHDNSAGICAISAIFDFNFARQHVEYGTRTGFCYNNQSPGTFELRAVRQGGDIAFYKICAGMVPTLWETLWLCVGILIAGFKGWASTQNLAWLKLRAIDIALERKAQVSLFGPTRAALFITNLVYNVCIWRRLGGMRYSFRRYFRAEHPINLLAEGL